MTNKKDNKGKKDSTAPKKRLGVKDFITVGIFTAIIFVVEFA